MTRIQQRRRRKAARDAAVRADPHREERERYCRLYEAARAAGWTAKQLAGLDESALEKITTSEPT